MDLARTATLGRRGALTAVVASCAVAAYALGRHAVTAPPAERVPAAAVDDAVARLAAGAAALLLLWWAVGLACALLAARPSAATAPAAAAVVRTLPSPVRALAAAVLGVALAGGSAASACAAAPPSAVGEVAAPEPSAALDPAWSTAAMLAAGSTPAASQSSTGLEASTTGTPESGALAPAPPGPSGPSPSDDPGPARAVPGRAPAETAPAGAAATATPTPSPVPAPQPPTPGATTGEPVTAPAAGWTAPRSTAVPTAPQDSVLVQRPRPAAAVDGEVVVRRGDTLWDLCARHLPEDATDAQIAADWPRWYEANREVIGPDPDLLLPGQRLQPPG